MNWTGRTLLLGMVVGLGGCGPLSMERVPSAKQVEMMAGPLLIEADAIHGVYMNLDVESIIFTYHTKVKTKEKFDEALSMALANSHWKKTMDTAGFLEFCHLPDKGSSSKNQPDVAILANYNVCRLSFNPESGTVVVACGQNGGSWTEEVIWSKFEELRSKRSADNPPQEKNTSNTAEKG